MLATFPIHALIILALPLRSARVIITSSSAEIRTRLQFVLAPGFNAAVFILAAAVSIAIGLWCDVAASSRARKTLFALGLYPALLWIAALAFALLLYALIIYLLYQKRDSIHLAGEVARSVAVYTIIGGQSPYALSLL